MMHMESSSTCKQVAPVPNVYEIVGLLTHKHDTTRSMSPRSYTRPHAEYLKTCKRVRTCSAPNELQHRELHHLPKSCQHYTINSWLIVMRIVIVGISTKRRGVLIRKLACTTSTS
jgi:hypothetical protein